MQTGTPWLVAHLVPENLALGGAGRAQMLKLDGDGGD